MSFLVSIIPTIVVLGILIIIHEYGHFIACRLTGVKVEKFSVGFGKEILKWKGKRETEFVVSALPLGGYVKPQGESLSEVDPDNLKKGDFLAAPLWARMVIIVAGVVMNYVLAIVLFSALFMIGKPVPGPEVGGFVEGYPAADSGLQVGDRILDVNGIPVGTWTELTEAFSAIEEKEFIFRVDRAGEAGTVQKEIHLFPNVVTVDDVFGDTHELKRIGITPNPESNILERYGFRESVQKGFGRVVEITVMTHRAIGYLIMGKMSMRTLSGPIGIINLTGQAAKLGLRYLIELTAILSISLAVINLLPIPALDGGHFLFLLIEGIRRRRLSLKFQERATQVGFALLMVLMVFVVYNDLINMNVFEKVKGFFSS